VPVCQIKFWDYYEFITVDDEVWLKWEDTEWTSLGFWPGPAAAQEGHTPSPRLRTTPNPSAGRSAVSFTLSKDGLVDVEIVDATGRIVRNLLSAELPAGEYAPEWNGRGDHGRRLPAGLYLTRIVSPDGVSTGRVVLVE
jgi:hypothetical protein